MATKEQKQVIDELMRDFITSMKVEPPDFYRVDYGQGGVRIETKSGELPFGNTRYTPTEFMAALQFATTVAIKEKK